MTDLERSLQAYAEFLDEESVALLPDHTPLREEKHLINANAHEGHVIMVDLLDKTPDLESEEDAGPSGRLQLLLTAVAAVVVVLFIGVLATRGESDNELDTISDSNDRQAADDSRTDEGLGEPEPAVSEPSPASVAVAEQFFALLNAGDLDGVEALLASDIEVWDPFETYDRDEWLMWLTWRVGQGMTFEDLTCAGQASGEYDVACEFSALSAPVRVTGIANEHETRFAIADGQIFAIRELGSQDHNSSLIHFEAWLPTREGDGPQRVLTDFDSVEHAFAEGELFARLVEEWGAQLDTYGCDIRDTPCNPNVVIARSFLEARNGRQGATLSSMLAESAVVSDPLARTAADYEAVVRFEQAIGRTIDVTRCREGLETPAGRSRWCSYDSSNAWSEALDLREASGVVDIDIEGGVIVGIEELGNPLHEKAWEVFEPWLRENHVDEVDLMLDADGTTPLLTDESIALWAQYTDEFVAEVSAG